MSWLDVQRVAVRLHHDPSLVQRLDDPAALADADLSEPEQGWLRAVDRRAWGADAGRRDRVLEALRREYPAACALAETASGREALLAFFAERAFHACVMADGVLARAFGDWLIASARSGRLGKAPTAAVATLERLVVDARRWAGTPGGLGAGRAIGEAPSGSLELLAAVRARLAGRPVGLPKPGRGAVWVLAEPDPAQPGSHRLGEIPGALAEALRGDAAAVLAAHGVEPTEAAAMLAQWRAEGLLGD